MAKDYVLRRGDGKRIDSNQRTDQERDPGRVEQRRRARQHPGAQR